MTTITAAPAIGNAIGTKLRRVGHDFGRPPGSIGHWCPACGVMHAFPESEWNGNSLAPSFTTLANIAWGGEVKPQFKAFGGGRCHYALRAGVLAFFADCTHELAGQSVPLPELPGHLRD